MEVYTRMTMRRYAVTLTVMIALLAAAIFLASGGPQHSAQADTVKATATPTATPSTSDNSTDNSSDNSEGDIGSNGSDTGGTVLDGVGETQNVDPGNRLDSAKVIRQNVNDGQEEYARYCFTDQIQSLNTSKADEFAVMGPDSSTGVSATDVRLDENRDDCVIAGFQAGTDLKGYTVAAVLGGVVKNRDGQRNVADTISLSNGRGMSSDDRTAGPDLVKVRISKNLNEVQYTFDEVLDKGSANASNFGFYSKAGGHHTGSSVVSTFNKTVTVKFDSNDQVDTGQRWFVTSGGVQDTDGIDDVLGTTSGKTDAPDLTSVTRDASDTEYDYKFDENVGNLDASDFLLYTNDGTEIQADSISTDGDVVHATFSQDIEDYPNEITIGAVNPSDASDSSNSDTSDSSDGTMPTIGAVDLSSTNITRRGRTTGPDLTGVSKNADDQRITLTFDEKLDDSSDNTDASGIYLATSDNRLVQADSILSIKGHKVYVKANKTDIKALKGIVLEAGAVTDKQGNTNPLSADVWGSGDTISGSSSSLYSHTTHASD
jgi:hypothetical protein